MRAWELRRSIVHVAVFHPGHVTATQCDGDLGEFKVLWDPRAPKQPRAAQLALLRQILDEADAGPEGGGGEPVCPGDLEFLFDEVEQLYAAIDETDPPGGGGDGA